MWSNESRALSQAQQQGAKSFDTLTAGTRLRGTVTYSSDPQKPAIYFATRSGEVFVKSCEHETSKACYAIQMQAVFALSQDVEVISGVVLEAAASSSSKTLYRLTLGEATLLIFPQRLDRRGKPFDIKSVALDAAHEVKALHEASSLGDTKCV